MFLSKTQFYRKNEVKIFTKTAYYKDFEYNGLNLK